MSGSTNTLASCVMLGGLLSLVWINWGESAYREWRKRGKNKSHRLELVFRHQVPFYEHILEMGSVNGVIHEYFLGVRNIDQENTVPDVSVKLIGCSDLISNVPLVLAKKDGEERFNLAPNEMQLVKFATQRVDWIEGGGTVLFHGSDGPKSWINPNPNCNRRLRIGAYGLDAYAFCEVAVEFDEDKQFNLPKVIGDYPEGDGQLLVGPIKMLPPTEG